MLAHAPAAVPRSQRWCSVATCARLRAYAVQDACKPLKRHEFDKRNA